MNLSALDSKSERLVQETINRVIKGHTVKTTYLFISQLIKFLINDKI